MDQLLGVYQYIVTIQNMIDLMFGANNLVLKNTKSTQLEQGQAIVSWQRPWSLVILALMNPNGIGVIAKIIIGITNP